MVHSAAVWAQLASGSLRSHPDGLCHDTCRWIVDASVMLLKPIIAVDALLVSSKGTRKRSNSVWFAVLLWLGTLVYCNILSIRPAEVCDCSGQDGGCRPGAHEKLLAGFQMWNASDCTLPAFQFCRGGMPVALQQF